MNLHSTLQARLQELAALPADRPMGMPGAFYTSQEQFDHEAATVLRKGWHCLGRQDEIPEPGDCFTATLLNEPLIVVRGDDDQIRVLANVCRHRGMLLAEGQGSVKRFTSTYRAWMYGRDGALLRAPRMENAAFNPAKCRLHQHNIHLWNGFIYVNLSAEAEPFCFNDLDTMLAPYETENFHLVHKAEEDWHTNWKCLVENFMEGYHLSVVHPQTLHEYTPTGLARKLVSGPGFTSYAANYPEQAATRGEGAPGLSDDERRHSSLFAVFPTHVASQAATLLASLYIFPINANLIRVKWTLSTYKDELDDETVKQRIALWEQVNSEDREKLERMQIALASSHAVEGLLAGDDYEGAVQNFQIWLAQMDTPGYAAK